MELDNLIKKGFADEERNRYTPPETYEHMWNVIDERVRSRKTISWREPFYRFFMRCIPATVAVAAVIFLFVFGKSVFYPSHVYEDVKETAPIHPGAQENVETVRNPSQAVERSPSEDYTHIYPSYIPEGFRVSRRTMDYGIHIALEGEQQFILINIMPEAFAMDKMRKKYKGTVISLDKGGKAYLDARYAGDNNRIESGKLWFNMAGAGIEMAIWNMPREEVLEVANLLEIVDEDLPDENPESQESGRTRQQKIQDEELMEKALVFPSFQRATDFSRDPPLLEEVLADFTGEGIPYEVVRANNAPKNVDWEGRVIAAGARQGILFLTVQDKKAPHRGTKELVDERLEELGIKPAE